MKKALLLNLALLIALTGFAKKVKFAVDMTGQTISANGVHVAGDFQTAAGYAGGDWQSGTTTLTQVGSSSIYSIVVDIPAFHKYEYKFVNGDQFYDVEFVPVESRVGYNFNDNRWLYVDSLGNDTTYVGAIMYSANAPAGLKLIRFKVDLRTESSVNAAGAHVAGSFQGSNPATTRLYSFGDSVYEYIAYVTAGSYTYKYYNGNSAAGSETVPSACATSGDRTINTSVDTVLNRVCFSSCAACLGTGIETASNTKAVSIFPNPTNELTTVEFNDNSNTHQVSMLDVSGRTVRSYNNYTGSSLHIARNELTEGIYFIRITNNESKIITAKIVIQ